MKIFNENKTQELKQEDLDFEKGHLQPDKRLIAHHEAIPFAKGKSAEEIYNNLKADGLIAVRMIGGKYYTVDRAFENGVEIDPLTVTEWISGAHSSSVTEIADEPDTPAQEAHDDYEDIQIYIPYTEEELQSIAKRKNHTELKAELAKIKEDIEQEVFGLLRDDYAEKKARAAEIINELRVLEGKEPRKVKTE